MVRGLSMGAVVALFREERESRRGWLSVRLVLDAGRGLVVGLVVALVVVLGLVELVLVELIFRFQHVRSRSE